MIIRFLGGLVVASQALCAIHAVRRQNYQWLWIIFIFPGIGSAAYFFYEYLPEIRSSFGYKKTAMNVLSLLNPGGQIRTWQREVEKLPSVRNKTKLAQAYLSQGNIDAAIEIYEDCLKGVHEDDPFLFQGVGAAYYFKKDYETALEYLEKLMKIREGRKNDDFDILRGRTYAALKMYDKAIEEFKAVAPRYHGEEPRVRMALLLAQQGKAEEAMKEFEEVVRNVKFATRHYRREQRYWYNLAKRSLRGLETFEQ